MDQDNPPLESRERTRIYQERCLPPLPPVRATRVMRLDTCLLRDAYLWITFEKRSNGSVAGWKEMWTAENTGVDLWSCVRNEAASWSRRGGHAWE